MTTPALEVDGITVRFGGLTAVDGVSLEVEPSELRAVIGPNGAGKTTFFNAITGEVPLERGSVKVAGQDITGVRVHKMRTVGLARGYQVPQVFGGMTVRENLWVAAVANTKTRLRPFTRARSLTQDSSEVGEMCETMGLTPVADRLADELSHADQKVLDIAIGLMSRPTVLLLDEPTQGVSPEEVLRIHDVVKAATQRTTILMIEHNMESVLALSDRVTVLANGAVIGEGTPVEVMDNDEVQRVYMGRRPTHDGTDG